MGNLTRLGITIGDPTGIGPEIVAAALHTAPVEWRPRIIVYGDREPLERAARTIGVPLPPDLMISGDGLGDGAVPGKPDERAGAAQVGYLEAAVAAARRGELAAIITAPISKTWARRGGFQFLGHTEMLAARMGATDVAMLFAGPRLKVALATVHRPLAEVVDDLSTERVRTVIELLVASLVNDFGMATPTIGVVGLNPHAGEDGLFGDEEGREIIPAIEVARAEGLNLTGPLPADTLFSRARGGEFDIVVAMYHDQGHIPVKTLGFEYDEASKKWTGLSGVNVTVGLPFLRVSVDHGTAFDRAWKGIANHESMVEALVLAATMLRRA